ncbi:hypothetical protein [Gluconobacter sp. Dm-62]|uniref:hypothetical protein n=1 Tax=Gluconobacter sp. Dm-62 TaxID=2799804 RepID=UPI00201257C4|nr:hypothetical protein [Gluconobacter sp. Dm-62]
MNGKPADQQCQANLEKQTYALRQDLFMAVFNKKVLTKLLNQKLDHRNNNKSSKERLNLLTDVGGFFNPVQHERLLTSGLTSCS